MWAITHSSTGRPPATHATSGLAGAGGPGGLGGLGGHAVPSWTATDPELQCQLAATVVMSTLVLAKDRTPLRLWFQSLHDLAAMSVRCAQWLCLVSALALSHAALSCI